MRHVLLLTSSILSMVGCVSPRGTVASSGGPPPSIAHSADRLGFDRSAHHEARCSGCGASNDRSELPPEIARVVETRIVDLEMRGGECARYGAVLERSYRGGRIAIRPFMWRVGTHLTSGEATPNGDMTLAREIDSLNVGVRTVDDVLWTMEHEAAHIAFDFVSGNDAREEQTNQAVSACRAAPVPTLTIVGLDGRSRTIGAADLALLTRHDTTVSAHEVSGRYSGVALTDLLALVNAPLADSLRGRALATFVLVEAADGYRVLFSIAELDARFTDRVVLLADSKDGQPLPTDEGPYRLIVPGEKRPARWARQVTRISLGRAP